MVLHQGLHHKKKGIGIDYDEVFSSVARIEAIGLFLAYALFKEFVVYQMDFKSAFLYGKIEEEVYVCQPPRFEDPDFPDRVYKVENALYGLHQAPRAWYETLSTYLLDNGFQRGKIDKTLFIRRDKAYPKVHENLKLITDERVIDDNPESHSGSMSSMKNLDDTYNFGDQFLYDKPTEDDQEKSKVREESDSTIPDPSHQTVTSTPPVIAPFTDVSSTKPSLLVTPPPINTEATTITTSLPEITPFIALQLRVARLEQEMSEVKKTDHSADVLASIKSQVPTAVDKYLGTKLDDALLKVLERHTADLIKKYSVLPGPESIQNQESEKSPKEIIRTKREQGEEKQDSTYSIRSTDKVDLEEFDLKSALFKHMNKIKSANRNTALMEALIADEDAMDKEVAVKVKDHKRKHDSDDDEDDDDDEGPSAGSNQGRSTKRRRSDSAASGSAQPPPKDDDQSSKKPRESDASASKQHPALTSTGWQITDTRDVVVDSSMHRSDPESKHSEQSSDDILMQDERHVSDMKDTDNTYIPKVSTTTWFKPIPEGERPATPEPEWTIPPNDFPEPENNWTNTYATTYQVPAENKLQRDISKR
ncbi:retrovirus-related pol polyprotein from transposon TNT 1-94 [Tanacetum coccineum]|uniref:Retrovirus-related pol polyprotein from transposon TNT 1-94 n=1 Tax=Tanacetum coccineum TaxID=301880 RepID=A0ABQ4ZWJ1_9ASTR